MFVQEFDTPFKESFTLFTSQTIFVLSLSSNSELSSVFAFGLEGGVKLCFGSCVLKLSPDSCKLYDV